MFVPSSIFDNSIANLISKNAKIYYKNGTKHPLQGCNQKKTLKYFYFTENTLLKVHGHFKD